MGLKFREHWFGLTLATVTLVFLLFVVLVAIAPHNDRQMRGFTPCTYEMGQQLSEVGAERRLAAVMSTVLEGYMCYASVIKKGVTQWVKNEQATPWENYLFRVDTYEISPEDSEPFSEDLLKANLLDDDENENLWQYENEIKEYDDAEK